MKSIALLAGPATAFAIRGFARYSRRPVIGGTPRQVPVARAEGGAMAAPLIASFATLDAPVVAAPSAWTGHFVYEPDPEGPAGPRVTHSLVIAPGRCLLAIEQDGATEQVACDAIVRDDSLILLAGEDGRYRQGTPLLKLSREEHGIVTHWLGYAHAPADSAAGACFVRR